MKEKQTQIDLSDKLLSLVKSKAQGVEGIDPLIESVIKEIMEKSGVDPETANKFRKEDSDQ